MQPKKISNAKRMESAVTAELLHLSLSIDEWSTEGMKCSRGMKDSGLRWFYAL